MIRLDDVSTKQSHEGLKQELQDEEYRYAYAEDFLNTWIAAQIVTLREQRGFSQVTLGELIGTKQPGVSRLEDVNHTAWKTDTLKRVARALGVRLRISFETFGTLLDEDAQFSRAFLRRPEFKDDPAFQTRKPPVVATVNVPGATQYETGSSQDYHYTSYAQVSLNTMDFRIAFGDTWTATATR